MESTNVNQPENEDEQLRALLQIHAPTLPDDGFSARVMQALTPPPPQVPRLGLWLGLAGAAAGFALAVQQAGSWSDLSANAGDIAHAVTPVLTVLAEPGFVLALSLVATSLLVTLVVSRPCARLY